MHIKKEEKSGLVHELIIEITKEDYAEKVEQALKKQRRQAQIPGFRVGFTPMGLIKRMYEKPLIAEEVNSMIGDALYGYLGENKIDFMFEPLAVNEKSAVDFENSDKFTFVFEYALRPKFDLNLSEFPEIVDYQITASQDMIDKYIDGLRKKYGEFSSPETVGEDDYLSFKYGEDNALQNSLLMSSLNEEGKKAFIGKKVDDVITVSLKEIFAEPAAFAKFLKIKEEEIEAENPYTENITITFINRLKEAELNEAFYEKAYPDGSVNSEEELKKAAAAILEAEWEKESERYFMDTAITTLMDNLHIELPDDFIKRYILSFGKEMTAEKVEEEYNDFKKGLIWHLIEDKICAENNIIVTIDEIKDYVRQFFVKNYFANFNQDDIKDRLDILVEDALKNKKDLQNIRENLKDVKITEVFKTQMKAKRKVCDINTFIEETNGEKAAPKKAKTKKSAPKATPETPADTTTTEPEVKAKPAVKKTKAAPKTKEN
jgi:trigger factor